MKRGQHGDSFCWAMRISSAIVQGIDMRILPQEGQELAIVLALAMGTRNYLLSERQIDVPAEWVSWVNEVSVASSNGRNPIK